MILNKRAACATLLSQDHAEQKYAEAAKAAVEACAEDTADQTCFICMDGADSGEGLVRMCACRGHSGIAHVSCLVRQAQVMVQEGLVNEEDNLVPRLKRWWICRLYKQNYRGAAATALGWACWKTYVGRPEGDHLRNIAMQILADSMCDDASGRLAILETILNRLESEGEKLYVRGQIATCYTRLERHEECLALRRANYEARSASMSQGGKLQLTIDYGESLTTQREPEAVDFSRELVARTKREFGEDSAVTERCLMMYGRALFRATKCTPEDLIEAEAIVTDVAQKYRRRLGPAHPSTQITEAGACTIRSKIAFNGVLDELVSEARTRGVSGLMLW